MRARIRAAEFKEIDCLNINNSFSQGVLSSINEFLTMYVQNTLIYFHAEPSQCSS